MPFSLTIVADGRHLATGVNGCQATDRSDDRRAVLNPRRGLSNEDGTIPLQAHDPKADVEIRPVRNGGRGDRGPAGLGPPSR